MWNKGVTFFLVISLLTGISFSSFADDSVHGLKSIQSHNFSNSYIRHAWGNGMLTTVSSVLDKDDSAFNIVPGLSDSDGVSFEASNYPGCYLRHSNYQIFLNCYEDNDLYRNDATFYVREGLADQDQVSFESANFPGHYIRHRIGYLFIDPIDGTEEFSKEATYVIRSPLTEGDIDGMTFYFGNIHSHTDYSDGDGTPAEAYLWARDNAGYDFYAVTDHAIQISPSEWDRTKEHADSYNNPGYFVTLRGFEWSHPLYGHVNVYNTSKRKSFISTLYLPMFYDWLDDHNGLAQFNHPGREDWEFNDFKYQRDVADDNFFAIETGNKNTGNNDYEFLSYFSKVLDKGWKVAPTNNQDNHSLSTNSHRTVMVMPNLTREDMLNTMRAKRIYSSDDPNMKVVFKYGDAWMGETVNTNGEPLEFRVEVYDDEPIYRIEIISNGGEVVRSLEITDVKESVKWNPVIMQDNKTYYYAKVYESNQFDSDDGNDTQITVTAPIWIQ